MKIVVFGSECNSDKLPIIKGLFNKLGSLGADVCVEKNFAAFLSSSFDYEPDAAIMTDDGECQPDIALSVGGDGTFLRTALQINSRAIPILGINIGRLGFLADVSRDRIDETLEELLVGNYRVEERSLLRLHDAESAFEGFNYALNEIAVLKRDTSSMITIHTYLDNDYLTSYKADGLVIATPTGSTAYSMSVNGPILLPQNRNIIISPVAPHSLNVRPIVIPDDCQIMLNVESRNNSFLVSLDGRNEDFLTGKNLIISKADITTRVIKRYNQTFYHTLREKLMWGVDVRS
ncbi:MAG: NAD kinase [Tannerella sp.]|jgi:NAD+ kinase|nr:NAD kinase [Tannerella sp.]